MAGPIGQAPVGSLTGTAFPLRARPGPAAARDHWPTTCVQENRDHHRGRSIILVTNARSRRFREEHDMGRIILAVTLACALGTAARPAAAQEASCAGVYADGACYVGGGGGGGTDP